MPYILTLVASGHPLSSGHIARAQEVLDRIGIRLSDTQSPAWLAPHHAADVPIDDFPRPDQLRQIRDLFMDDEIDVFATEASTRNKKLLLADMESTLIQNEMLDELAATLGMGPQVAKITARAMCGELDFATALNERLHLLKGVPENTLLALRARITLSPGAETLIRTLTAHHVICVLISGGFTCFTAPVAAQLGFHYHHGNTLDLEDAKIAGTVSGRLIDKQAKQDLLQDYALRLNIPLKLAAAVGDGANDLPMLQTAGLGVGYHPKPLLRESLDALILHGDLTALLYAMGYTIDQLWDHKK